MKKCLLLLGLVFSLLSSPVVAVEIDEEQARTANNERTINRFTQVVAAWRISAEAAPVLQKLTEAHETDSVLLEAIEDVGLSDRLREAAAHSLEKHLLTEIGTVEKTLDLAEDDSVPQSVRIALIDGALLRYVNINSIHETEERARLILSRVRETESDELKTAYLAMLGRSAVPAELLDRLLVESLNHPNESVREQAALAFVRPFQRPQNPAALFDVLFSVYRRDTEVSVKVALLKSIGYLSFEGDQRAERSRSSFLVEESLKAEDPALKHQASQSFLYSKGYVDPETRNNAFLGGSPWSEPWFAQRRRNLRAKLKLIFSKMAHSCGSTLCMGSICNY
ncbi:MAG: hypothetical protein AAF202_02915 [Pseudomonadota bacterium]